MPADELYVLELQQTQKNLLQRPKPVLHLQVMLTKFEMRNKPKNAVTLNLYLQPVKSPPSFHIQTFLYIYVRMLYEAAFNGSINVHKYII